MWLFAALIVITVVNIDDTVIFKSSLLENRNISFYDFIGFAGIIIGRSREHGEDVLV